MDGMIPKADVFAAIPSKRGRENFIRDILNSYAHGERVKLDDDALLRVLIHRHPDREQKLAGQAISHFEVRHNRYGTLCFCLVRTDGSRDDFSYKKCL